MKIVLTGGSGFIGSFLRKFWQNQDLVVLRRPTSSLPSSHPIWDPPSGEFPYQEVEGADLWVHLSGESIEGRWTRAKKERLFQSRVETSRFLVNCLLQLESPPKLVATASAIGYYGKCREEELDELSPAGEGFLASLCQSWEKVWTPFWEKGNRVIFCRFGIVLHPSGGALKRMLLPFRLGLGGPLGSGGQWMSWIHIQDVAKALEFCLETPHITGAVNFTSPHPVTNREFSQTLAKVLKRPAFCRVPPFLLKLLFGREMVEETVLSSLKVVPKKLLEAGFSFSFPKLQEALEDLLR